MTGPLGAAAAPKANPWQLPDVSGMVVAVLGGTGSQGRGLATRFTAAGMQVVIGSRDRVRAVETAGEVGREARGTGNAEAARAADVAILAVPWSGHEAMCRDLAKALAGCIVVDCVNPLAFDERGCRAVPVPEGSAAEQAAVLLSESRVVAAFNHISSALLGDLSIPRIETDVLVCGDDREATDTVQALAEQIPGVRGIYAGRLRTAGAVEAITANVLSINRRYRANTGFTVTGLARG